MLNAQIATLAAGLISISEARRVLAGPGHHHRHDGGTLFMAFGSAQGPQLGLPIGSRCAG